MLLDGTSKQMSVTKDSSSLGIPSHVQHQQNKMADEQFGAKSLKMAGKGAKTSTAAKLNIPIKLVSYLDRYKFVI